MSKQIIGLLLFLGISTNLLAQKVSYPQLVMRSNAPTLFLDNMVLPGEDGKTELVFLFRFDNDFIPFKKVPMNSKMDVPDNGEFYSTIRLNAEIFNGNLKSRNENLIKSVARDTWTDTLFASTFDETQSKNNYASGTLSTQLEPGEYHYILQLSMMQEVNERNTQRRDLKIPDLNTKETGEVMLIRNNDPDDLKLMNMGNNIPFGKDFTALIRIPDYSESETYRMVIEKAQIQRGDTSTTGEVYSGTIASDDIRTNTNVQLRSELKEPTLQLTDGSYTYALVNVPASQFENAGYMLKIMKDGTDKPLARRMFRSYWADMPASLLNLNVAINNLKYIVPEKEVRRLSSGNNREKENKFRQFWDSKDPTPNTVYNELMAEYYRRIDYAFKEFGSQQFPMGHESDMGEIYIKFGPPKDKERRFPESGKTIEIWEYPNRTFVFEATSGFGDFVLKGSQ